MAESFMINQLMINWFINTMKLERYQQDKVMIIRLDAYQILFISKKNCRLIAADLSKQKVLDSNPRVIQQIIFTGKASENIAIYYILEQLKETILKFSKGTTNVL